MNRSIKIKLILNINIVILILVIGMALIAYNQSKNVVNDLLLSTVENTVEQYAEIVTNSINSNVDVLMSLDTYWFTRKEAIIDGLDDEMILLSYWSSQNISFSNKADNKEQIESLFAADLQGNFRNSEGVEGNIGERTNFQNAIDTKEIVISKPYIKEDSEEWVFSILRPVIVKDKIRIILGGVFKLSAFQSSIEAMNINDEGYGMLLDQDNRIIAHDNPDLLGEDILALGNDNSLKIAAKGMKEGNKGNIIYTKNNIDMWLAYAPIKRTDWSIAITADSEKVLAPLDIIRTSSVWMVVLAMIVGVIVTYFIAKKIAEPIIYLSGIANKIAEGDLTHKVRQFKRKDELGVLVNAVGRMSGNLRDMINKIKSISVIVQDSSQELYISGEQVGKSAEVVGSEVEHLAAGAEEQTAQIEEMVTAIKNLTSQIQEIGESSNSISKGTDHVMENIDMGNKSVDETIEKIRNVKRDTSDVAADINKLGKVSEEIGGIIELINSIASQTNLLALNAAIEAARAGEAGQGFSVVAEEIRTLAEESANATEKIASLIQQIKESVAEVIKKMENNVISVDQSVSVTKDTQNTFNQIDVVIHDLTNSIQDVSRSLVGMTKNSETVENIITNVAKVSQGFSESSEEVAASSEEQIATTEGIIDASDKLEKISIELSNAIAQFKI